MSDKPVRLRLVAGDTAGKPDSDDRPPVPTLPDGPSLPPLLRGLRLVLLPLVAVASGTRRRSRSRHASLVGSIGRYVGRRRSRPWSGFCSSTRLVRAAAAIRWRAARGPRERLGPDAWREADAAAASSSAPPRLDVLTLPRRIARIRVSTRSSRAATTSWGSRCSDAARCAHASDVALVVADLGSADRRRPPLSDRSRRTWCWVWSAQRPKSLADAYRLRRWSAASIWSQASPWFANQADDDARRGRLRVTRASISWRYPTRPRRSTVPPNPVNPRGVRSPNSGRLFYRSPEFVWPSCPRLTAPPRPGRTAQGASRRRRR